MNSAGFASTLHSRRGFLRASLVGGSALAVALPRLACEPPQAVAGATGVNGSLLHGRAAWDALREELTRRAENRAVLAREADAWLKGDVLSVVGKKHPAPSGDPHDYVSLAPYRWPDPKKPDGRPWTTRDGEVNPAFYEYDNPKLERLCHAVPRLVLHAWLTGSEVHARRAGRLLRAWFVEPDTRMNPHLRFAQMTPGMAEGTPTGIIDTTSFVFLADAASRLSFNTDWTPQHLAALKTWFAQYTEWLLTSKAGRTEGAARNNHGVWYDAQVAAFAVFSGRPDIARRQIESATRDRIAAHIEPDGRQPAELRRTLALTYCTYNLLAHACVAQLAAPLGLDLWRWQSTDDRGLRVALRWLLPYYAKERAWSHPQIRPFDFGSAALLLHLAEQGLADAEFGRVRRVVEVQPWHRVLFSKAAMSARKEPHTP